MKVLPSFVSFGTVAIFFLVAVLLLYALIRVRKLRGKRSAVVNVEQYMSTRPLRPSPYLDRTKVRSTPFGASKILPLGKNHFQKNNKMANHYGK